MAQKTLTLQDVIDWINQQSLTERLTLIQQIFASLAKPLPSPATKIKPLRSLYGLWRGFSISAEDIAQARREMWGEFAERGV